MRRRGALLLFLAGAVMELSWLGAWAGFTTLAVMGRPFPFAAGSAVLLTAALVTRLVRGRGWRRVSVLLVHGCAFAASAFVLLDALYEASHLFPVVPQLRAFVAGPKTSMDWVVLFVNACFAFLFYWRGLALAGGRKDYYAVCRRFDLGLAAFFLLFVTKLLLMTKGGIKVDDPAAVLMVFPFFLFSLMAIGVTRTQDQGRKRFLPGYGALGILFSFVSLVLLLAGGLILFLLPGLTAAARAGLDTVKPAGSAFGSLFLWAVRFLYVPKTMRAEPAGGLGPKWDSLAHMQGGWWSELIGRVMAWGLGGIAALATAGLVATLLFFLVRWLFSRTAGGRQEKEARPAGAWLSTLKAILLSLVRRAARAMKRYERASELFGALSAWGRRSGFPHGPAETPAEFAARLQREFPLLQADIGSIVHLFHEEVYGERLLSPPEFRSALAAWANLRSPHHWPMRMKARLRAAI